MREWLRLKLLEKLGGYPDVQTALTAVSSEEERRAVLTLAVKKLFNTIGAEDILQVNGDLDWIFLGKALPAGARDQLMAEAEQLLGMRIWEVLNTDIKYQANKAMFIKSRNELDIVAGKLWLHSLYIFNRRLKAMAAGSGMLQLNKKKG